MADLITKKQIEELNSRCKNGWELDVSYLLYHQEKTFIKIIKLENEGYLEFRIYYNREKQVALHIRKFTYKDNESCATTEGLGKVAIVNETKYSKKKVNNLIMVTGRLTVEELLKIDKETKVLEEF